MKSLFNHRKVFAIVFVMLSFRTVAQNSQLTWTEVMPGVWKGVVGVPEGYDLLKASGSVPNKEALSKMATVVFPISQNDVSGKSTMVKYFCVSHWKKKNNSMDLD